MELSSEQPFSWVCIFSDMCQGKVDLDGFGGVTSRSPGRVIREVVSLRGFCINLQDLLTILYSCSDQYQRYLAIFVYNRQQELAVYSHTAGRRTGGIVRRCGIIPFRHRVERALIASYSTLRL